jgi:hypothetical protein
VREGGGGGSAHGIVRTKSLMAHVELGKTLSRKVNPDAFLFEATKGSKCYYELRKLRTNNAKK